MQTILTCWLIVTSGNEEGLIEKQSIGHKLALVVVHIWGQRIVVKDFVRAGVGSFWQI